MDDSDETLSMQTDDSDEVDLNINLVKCVKERSFLYDKSHHWYKEKAKIENAWSEIAEEVGLSHEGAKTRWTRLRNNFSKAISRRMPDGYGSRTMNKTWAYQDEMEFLREHITLRKAFYVKPNINGEAGEDESPGSCSPISTEQPFHSEIQIQKGSGAVCKLEDVDRNPIPTPSSQPVPNRASTQQQSVNGSQPAAKKPKLDELDSIMINYVKSLSKSKEEEPLIGWFQTLLPTLKTLPPPKLLDFQITVMQEMKKMVGDVQSE